MKHSIRLKITLTLVLAVASAIFLCWLLNRGFLEDFYQYSKIKSLDAAYKDVNNVLFEAVERLDNKDNTEDKSSSDFYYDFNVIIQEDPLFKDYELIDELERIMRENNVNVYIFQLFELKYASGTLNDSKRVKNTYGYYLLDPSLLGEDTVRLKAAEKYDVYKMYDAGKDSKYIDLFGMLDSGYILFLRSNFESIQESVSTANKFLSYIGIIAVLVGAVIMFIISRGFTRPILELSAIAKRMSDLDFGVKYKITSKDEIGELGLSINSLAKKLETTISELKSANNELQSDIQNKIQIDEMRKEFLSNVTHELKTPIALIQGYAEGLQDNINDDQESKEFYCEVIIDEAVKMNHMVKKLLSLNQIEFGANQVEMEHFDIVALIQSVILSTDILLKQKEIKVYFDEKNPVYVWADEYKIEEVVTNFISNAINHSSGAKIIEVKLIDCGDRIRVAVFNTGERIPEEELDKVWIKFYKVDKARTREYGGSGIGLSIVKAIMDAHNKECGAINHENGVEFWCELDAETNFPVQ